MIPNKHLIEERFRAAIDRFVHHGVPTGSFLYHVLSNNLSESIGAGDSAAIDNLPHIVAYLYNDCPSGCWGSKEAVDEWAGLEATTIKSDFLTP